jgi:hypothetical protein
VRIAASGGRARGPLDAAGDTSRQHKGPRSPEGRRYLGLDILARCRIRPVAGTDTDSDTTEEVTIPALSA